MRVIGGTIEGAMHRFDAALAGILGAASSPDRLPDDRPDAALIRRACDSGLAGLVLDAARREGWRLPGAHEKRLERHARRIRQANLHLLDRLVSIATALNERGIEPLLLKGAALNLTLYPRLDLRPMGDLDLLIRPGEIDPAVGAFEELGYQRGPGLVRRDYFPRYHYEIEFNGPELSPVRVDLHVRPFRPLRYSQTVAESFLWGSSRAFLFQGTRVRVAAVEEQLIQLAVHSACHGHERLIWLYDICRLILERPGRLDWDAIVALCREYRLVLPVRETLERMESLWSPLCPDRIRGALAAEPVGWRDRWCLRQTPHDSARPLRHVAVNLLCTQGVRFRLGYLAAMLVPDAEHLGQRYGRRHRGWVPAAHAQRMLRVAVQPARRVVRALNRFCFRLVGARFSMPA